MAAALVLMCACLVFIHAYAAAATRAVVRARGNVWQNAMTGCQQPIANIQDLVDQAGSTDDAGFAWSNFVPSVLDASESFSVPWLFSQGTRGGTKQVSFMCNPVPSTANPLLQPAEWLLSMIDTD